MVAGSAVAISPAQALTIAGNVDFLNPGASTTTLQFSTTFFGGNTSGFSDLALLAVNPLDVS